MRNLHRCRDAGHSGFEPDGVHMPLTSLKAMVLKEFLRSYCWPCESADLGENRFRASARNQKKMAQKMDFGLTGKIGIKWLKKGKIALK